MMKRQPTFSSKSHHHLLAKQRAAAVALASIDTGLAMIPHCEGLNQFNRLSKERRAMEIGMLEIEHEFLDDLENIDPEERTHLLFETLDLKGRGAIGLEELTVSFRKLKYFAAIRLPSPEVVVETFASTTRGDLNLQDFSFFLDGLCASSVDCTLEQLSTVMIANFVFLQDSTNNGKNASRNGREFLHRVVNSILVPQDGPAPHVTDHQFAMAVHEARLMILFQAMMENDGSEVIQSSAIFKHLFRLASDIGHAIESQAIAVLQEKHLQSLDYEMFSDLMNELVKSVQYANMDTGIHEISNAMTLSLLLGGCYTESNDGRRFSTQHEYQSVIRNLHIDPFNDDFMKRDEGDDDVGSSNDEEELYEDFGMSKRICWDESQQFNESVANMVDGDDDDSGLPYLWEEEEPARTSDRVSWSMGSKDRMNPGIMSWFYFEGVSLC